jgi:hypothetical protein
MRCHEQQLQQVHGEGRSQQPCALGFGLLTPSGRVKQVLDRACHTSGRRLAAWGNLYSTYVHLVVSAAWYFGKDAEQLQQLYNRLYTDRFR